MWRHPKNFLFFFHPYIKTINYLVMIQNRNNIILPFFLVLHTCCIFTSMLSTFCVFQKQNKTNKKTSKHHQFRFYLLKAIYSPSSEIKRKSKIFGWQTNSVLLPRTAAEDWKPAPSLQAVCWIWSPKSKHFWVKCKLRQCWITRLDQMLGGRLTHSPYQTLLACHLNKCLTWISSTS